MEKAEAAAQFNRIYEQTFSRAQKLVVLKCANVSDTADIIQEAYSELYSVLLKKEAGYIENDEAFVMKLLQSSIYRHYRLLGKLKSKPHLELVNFPNDPEDTNEFDLNIEQQLLKKEKIEHVWRIINHKANEIRRIFYLYYYCDMTLKEIAVNLKMNESNVKHKLYGTLNELRTMFEKERIADERKGIL